MIRKIIFLEMLLLGIATFLYSQDEISKITITHGPYLQNVGSNEATIVWITDKPSICLLYTSPSPRDTERDRMPSSA